MPTEAHTEQSKGDFEKQKDTLSLQNNDDYEHKIGANMVHEKRATSLESDLTEIIQIWSKLPEHIRIAIKALIQTYNGNIKD